jgi:hypothetical protein
MTEPVNRKPASSKESVNKETDLDKHRTDISNIEMLLATTDPQTFTVNSIQVFINKINEIITWIRDNLDDARYDKQAMQANLINARIKFAVAIDQLNKGRLERCYKLLEAGRVYLVKALKCWS